MHLELHTDFSGGNLRCWRSWSWMVLWRPTRPFRINTLKRCPFHHRELECKSWKSRDTWSNRLIWPWSKKWSRAKANRVLPREHTDHSKHPLPTTQEMTLHKDFTRWSIPKSDWLYSEDCFGYLGYFWFQIFWGDCFFYFC